jgi:hypothetical protein
MNFTRPIDQAPVFPPAFSLEVKIPFIGPAPDLVNIIGLTCPGRAGYNELPELETNGKLNAPDELDFFYGFEYFKKWVFHERSIKSRDRFSRAEKGSVMYPW